MIGRTRYLRQNDRGRTEVTTWRSWAHWLLGVAVEDNRHGKSGEWLATFHLGPVAVSVHRVRWSA